MRKEREREGRRNGREEVEEGGGRVEGEREGGRSGRREGEEIGE